MFNINIYDDVMYLLEEIGNNCKVNNVDCKAIVNNTNNEHDDKRIITNEKLARGDYIEYNDLFFIVVDDVVDKRYNTYYKSKMRKCNFDVKFIIDKKLYLFYSIIESEKFFIIEDVINMSADTITVTLPLTDITKQIEKGMRFIKFNQAWKIEGIDYTKNNLITLHCKITQQNDNYDDIENEIADRWDKQGKDILEGNIEPILPFDEEPDKPEEPEEPDEPEIPDDGEITYKIKTRSKIHELESFTYEMYKYINDKEVEGNFEFEISDESLATITETTNNTCKIKANEEGNLGIVTLTITDVDENKIFKKDIEIVSLLDIADEPVIEIIEPEEPIDDEPIEQPEPETETYTITFEIKDKDDETVITDVTIELKDDEDNIITPENGNYIVGTGNYSYTVKKEGYKTQTGTIIVVDSDVYETVLLEKEPSEEPEPEEPDKPVITYEIEGSDTLHSVQNDVYTIHKYINDKEVEGNFDFEISDESLATIAETTNNTCKVQANWDDNTGVVTLTATDVDTNEVITKDIEIKAFF